ncbi:hypothetical protein FACS1894113_5730 [Alphaproteobacteria bacterium]|nr:hypothetical protein FACS1894113_5730 [Alphaproteobacteria bacterium]
MEKKKNEFLYDAPSGTAVILSYLEELYGEQFSDEFWHLNVPFIFEEIKLDELEEYSKTVDERLERYRQKQNQYYNYYYEIHRKIAFQPVTVLISRSCAIDRVLKQKEIQKKFVHISSYLVVEFIHTFLL